MGADGSRSPTNLQHVHATARWLSPFYGGLRGRFPCFAPMRLPFTSKTVEHSRYLPPLAGRANIPVHSLCTKENWKGQKRRDASKGQNGRSRRKAGFRTFTPWLTLGPKNGRTFSLCTTQRLPGRFP